MADWSQIRAGTRGRRLIYLPLGVAPVMPSLVNGRPVVPSPDADTIPIDLRPLTSGELADVLTRARADAVARGVSEPKDGNPIYDLCEMEHTLLLCCVDPDSAQDNPQPFFASIEQIRSEPRLGRQRIAYLFELFQRYQDDCSPHLRVADPSDTEAALLALGILPEEESARFFDSLGPALRWMYMRILASQRPIAPMGNFTPTSPSAPSTNATSTRPTSALAKAPATRRKPTPKKRQR